MNVDFELFISKNTECLSEPYKFIISVDVNKVLKKAIELKYYKTFTR